MIQNKKRERELHEIRMIDYCVDDNGENDAHDNDEDLEEAGTF